MLTRLFYSISYSLSSTAHFANLPDWLGLWSIVQSGWLVNTSIGWDWKYGRSFPAEVTTASAIFPSLYTWFLDLSLTYLCNNQLLYSAIFSYQDSANCMVW